MKKESKIQELVRKRQDMTKALDVIKTELNELNTTIVEYAKLGVGESRDVVVDNQTYRLALISRTSEKKMPDAALSLLHFAQRYSTADDKAKVLAEVRDKFTTVNSDDLLVISKVEDLIVQREDIDWHKFEDYTSRGKIPNALMNATIKRSSNEVFEIRSIKNKE